MEIQDFIDFLKSKGCSVAALDNLSAPAVRITREVPNSNIKRSHILIIYRSGEFTRLTIKRCCDALLLDPPDDPNAVTVVTSGLPKKT